ncbi:MAG: hypothetical protein LRS49_06205 [Desulfurococcales archaeon]|nr:hypothetical protein [Desulfurococcales archaeon]
MGSARTAAALLAAAAAASISMAARGGQGPVVDGFTVVAGGDPLGLALALSSAGAVGLASAVVRRLRRGSWRPR